MADVSQKGIGYALGRALRQPLWALRVAIALGRGHYYRAKFRLLGRKVKIGKRFRVIGRFDVRGPGTVIFGDDCCVLSSLMQVTTPWTHTPEAVIRFGDRVHLTGTRLGCTLLIEVGDDSGLSDARIMDSDFHTIERTSEHRSGVKGRSKPVVIGKGVWVAANAMILKGVRIGDFAVVGAGAVVTNNVPNDAVVMGNPARVVWRMRAPARAATPAPVPSNISVTEAPVAMAAAKDPVLVEARDGILLEP